MQPEDGCSTLSKSDMLKYRSGTGLLLYLVKHLRPDIANAVRELSKVMDKATAGHMKELLRCIKYVLARETKSFAISLTGPTGLRSLGFATWIMLEILNPDKASRAILFMSMDALLPGDQGNRRSQASAHVKGKVQSNAYPGHHYHASQSFQGVEY